MHWSNISSDSSDIVILKSNLENPRSRSWVRSNDLYPSCFISIGPSITNTIISKFYRENPNIHGQVIVEVKVQVGLMGPTLYQTHVPFVLSSGPPVAELFENLSLTIRVQGHGRSRVKITVGITTYGVFEIWPWNPSSRSYLKVTYM